MAYAENTSVPIDRSQAEIRKVLSRYGATGFAYGESDTVSMVMFEMSGRRIKMLLPMPKKPSPGATAESVRTYQQLCRSRWRCLVLVIKAKLESVESKITTLEQEFMAHIVLPNGQTVSQVMIPQIESAYSNHKMPPMLPGAS